MDQQHHQAPVVGQQQQQPAINQQQDSTTTNNNRKRAAKAEVNQRVQPTAAVVQNSSYYCHSKNNSNNPATNQAASFKTPLPVGAAPKYGSCELRDESSLRSIYCSDNSQPELRLVGSGKHAQGGGCDPPPAKPERKDWLNRMADRVPCLGIMLSLGASLFLGSAGMLVKMTQSVHGVQVAVFRAMIQLLVYGLVIKFRRLPWIPKEGERLPVLGRASLGAASITCSYFALKLIPLGDATVIRFSLPIWTLIVSYLVLNESCSLLKVAAVVISISGVVLIAKPESCIYFVHLMLHCLGLETDDQFSINRDDYHQNSEVSIQKMPTGPFVQEPYRQFEGSLLALCSSVCLAMSLIALRLCSKTPAEITILWLSILSILIGTITLVSMNEWRLPNNWLDLIYIILNGLCGSIGQWFITSALKIEQSGVISLARTFDIEVAFLYSAFLLKEQIRITSVIGSLLVSCGVLAVVVPKWLGSRNSTNNRDGKELPPPPPACISSIAGSNNNNTLARQEEATEGACQTISASKPNVTVGGGGGRH